MKQRCKRWLSVFLATAMILSILPISALAVGEDGLQGSALPETITDSAEPSPDADVPAPETETTAPETEASAPEAPAPETETPVSEEPTVQESAPKAEEPAPEVDAAEPEPDNPAPEPLPANAANTVYQKVTTAEELTSGKYVMVVSTGYAPGTFDNGWLTAVQIGFGQDQLTDPNTSAVWTLTVNGSTVTLADSNGITIAPKGGNYNGIKNADYAWNWAFANGTFQFKGVDADTVTLASNATTTGKYPGNHRFRSYKNTTVTGGHAADYPHDFTLYKLADGTAPVPPSPDPDKPVEPDPAVPVSIATALAGSIGTEFTVKGVVTLVDGQNLYIRDDTAGICLRRSKKFTELKLGDTVIGTGKRGEYKGTQQLINAVVEKVTDPAAAIELKPERTTIAQIDLTKDLYRYVKLTSLKITKLVDQGTDKNGNPIQYSNPNLTLEDNSGNTIQLYKAAVAKNPDNTWAVKVGDKINVLAAITAYGTTPQLRNTLPEEITLAQDPNDTLGILGKNVVIYNPANNKAISKQEDHFNRVGTNITVAADVVTGFTADNIWTVGSDGEGHYTFTSLEGGHILSMEEKYKSLCLDKVFSSWDIHDAGNSLVTIENVGRPNHKIKWNTYKGAANFNAYHKNQPDEENMKFFIVDKIPDAPVISDAPQNGDKVVIYNKNKDGEAVMGLADAHNASLYAVPATVTDNKATVGNGGRVFTVTVEGSDYIFASGNMYLAANDKENLLLTDKLDDYAKWNLEPAKEGTGLMMKNKAAKYTFQGSTDKKDVYIEYFGGKFTCWTLSKKNGYEIYNMQFLPCANAEKDIIDGIVNLPSVILETLPSAYVSQEYKLPFTVDAPFGLKSAVVTLNGIEYTPELVDGQYIVTVPVEEVKGEKLSFTIVCVDNKDVSFQSAAEVAVVDIPLISNPLPEPNSAVLNSRRPEISVTVSNAEKFTAEMTVNGQVVDTTITENKVSYVPAEDLADSPVTVNVKVVRDDKAENAYSWKFSIGQPMEQLYFGQLHSHTTYSDGAGSLENALDYVSKIPDRDNVDFVAFTDHSNYFDGKDFDGANPEGALYDMSLASQKSQDNWNKYKNTVANFNANQSKQVAIAGFEMTWSGGPGHINTFNTPGIVSRNNKTLNDKTADAGMKAYYALLSDERGVNSLSQFNHPGKTFGTFKDFAYWDPITDSRICSVEVGNGEGKIHQGGYYPSYGEYTKALDKGWHLAPTNNQDNHKGRWGNANDARDVILTDDFSEQGIYQAMRDMRMYATEDKNLEIFYTVNGLPMGSIIAEIPAQLDVTVDLHDPDLSDSISKVELVANSGKIAHTWTGAEAATGKLTCTLAPEYSYYYVRVTESDGDLAVTAPVWVGEVLKMGISSVESGTAMPVTGEELTVKTTLFNSEKDPVNVKKLTYATADGTVLAEDTQGYTIPSSSTKAIDWKHTFEKAKLYTIKVTVEMEKGGKLYTYSMDLELDVEDSAKLVYVGFDAAHYNEYVSGNYKDSMGNFANLASGYGVRTVYLNTSEELIAACANSKYKMLVLTAPSRRAPEAQKDPKSYTAAELDALNTFNQNGGTVVVAGWSDHYEDFPDALPKDFKHMSEAQNEVLAALGSSLRINDDATYDDKYSKIDGCDPWRLYFNTYNMDNPLNNGVIYDPAHNYDRLYTEVFSHYGGASIYAVDANNTPASALPATVSPVVFAHESTYSKDTDNDGKGAVNGQKYQSLEQDARLLIMASEQLPGRGNIIVSGAAFMSNFEVQAVMDNGQQKNYSNYRICENMVESMNQKTVDKIADVQAEPDEGVKFTIEGVVTSNASGHDKDTAFFDCIYLQDETAGINAFPVAGDYKIGDKVRITGHTSSYNGERQIAVKSIKKIGEGTVPEPKQVTATQINDRSVLGSLVTLKGTVTCFSKDNGLIQTIMVRDANGQEARVFIDGYISKAQDVKDLAIGSEITVTGLASFDNSFAGPAPRIRIRNRTDISCKAQPCPSFANGR